MDCDPENEYLPHNYSTGNIVAYIGTHDNETLVGFLKNCKLEQIEKNLEYFQARTIQELPDQVIRSLFACVANIAIVQMQDLLKLDNKARTNLPSTVGQNWRWRMTKEQYKEIDTAYYRNLCAMYNRARKESQEVKKDDESI